MSPGALDGKLLVMQKVFDGQDQFNVGLFILTLAGGGPLRSYHFEFRFPEPQDIGGESRNITDLSYFKVQFVRQFFLMWHLLLHLVSNCH